MIKEEETEETSPTPKLSEFSELLTNELLIKNLEEGFGFKHATPIQVATMPIVLEGKDICAGAKTGSGKTIAFLAPLAERILKGEIKRILVLTPTRELTLQIDEQAEKLLQGQDKVHPVALFGGVPTDQHIRILKRFNPFVYIATPGRMMDLIMEDTIALNEVNAVVLDEADRMCDMGFAPQVEDILAKLPNVKQSLYFSATMPAALDGIMRKYASNPVRIQVDASDESSETIRHQAIFVPRRKKMDQLRAYLTEQGEDCVAIIFTRTRKGSDKIYDTLKRSVKQLGILHAGFGMGDRERTIQQFRDEKIKVLVCTDVMARGIDVAHVTHVIHYDMPEGLDDYIHRSGRSGRAGRAGIALALVDTDDRGQVRAIEQFKEKIEIEMLGERNPPRSSSNQNRGDSDRPARGRGGQGRGGSGRSGGGRGRPSSNQARSEGTGSSAQRPAGERSAEDGQSRSRRPRRGSSNRNRPEGERSRAPRDGQRAPQSASKDSSRGKPAAKKSGGKGLIGKIKGIFGKK